MAADLARSPMRNREIEKPCRIAYIIQIKDDSLVLTTSVYDPGGQGVEGGRGGLRTLLPTAQAAVGPEHPGE